VLTHDLRPTPGGVWRVPGFHHVDGELLVYWYGHVDGELRGYWHSSAGALLPMEGLDSRWTPDSGTVTLPLPGGGRTTGGGVLHPGDTVVPGRHQMISDGTSFWRWDPDTTGWREYDPVGMTDGRLSMPGFLADALRSAPAGTVTDPGAALCSCLLAPRCLHRAAVLNTCPVADPDVPPSSLAEPDVPAGPGSLAEPDRPANVDSPAEPGALANVSSLAEPGVPAGPDRDLPDPDAGAQPAVTASTRPSAGQVAAAAGLWSAAAAVLAGGVPGAGAVPQAELLRAAHTARLAGLLRAEAAALRVVRGLRAARAHQGGHHLADMVSALRDLLLTSGRLAAADPDPALVGTARRTYRQSEELRVYGVCREPVISATGYGGVVTHLVTEDGRRLSVADVKPGGPARARGAATATVALGAASLNHAQLARGGLLIAGATISPDGRLGSGRGVRANPVAGLPWSAWPLAALFARPLADAADMTFSGDTWSDPQDDERSGQPVGCDLVIVGAEGDRLLARDVFGRLVDSSGDRYAWAWLAAAVHLTATERVLVQASWHDGHTLT
jgi:hypothetical protein